MNSPSIKQQLLNIALAKGICSEGEQTIATSPSLDSLVDYYVANPDWCLERDFPTLDFLRDNFADVGDKGVFVSRTFHGELLNDRQAYIFHNCKGTIKVGLNVDRAIIPMLYFANSCRLRVVGVSDFKPKRHSSPPRVPIYLFGHNDLSAKSNKRVEFVTYKIPLL